MRANVARHARRLLVRRATLPSCAAYATPARRRPIHRPLASRNFQRTFFGVLFDKAPREVRPPEYEPGWMDIMLWRSRMLDNLRPPPRKDLLEAWRKLMESKRQHHMPFNTTQASQCRRLLRYLCTPSSIGELAEPIPAEDLAAAQNVLLKIEAHDSGPQHLEFAQAIHEVWISGNYTGERQSRELQWSYLVKSMCRFGASQKALSMVYETWDDPAYSGYHAKVDSLVEVVARGLASEGHEKELVGLVEHAEGHGVPYDTGLQDVMTVFFAERDRVTETQHWFAKPITQKQRRPRTYRSMASFAMRNDLQEWATPIFLELQHSQPTKTYWDVLLQANLLLGKEIADVEVMMSDMVDNRKGKVSADIGTINGLLGVAVETNDLNLAAKLLTLGSAKGLAPNGKTFLAIWNLRLEMGDLVGCHGPYDQVQYFEPWVSESKSDVANDYRRMINKYLVALCRQTPTDFKLLAKVLAHTEEQRLRLEPKTVGFLCLRFLENDQHFDVIDILSMQSFLYSERERAVVYNAFLEFCCSPDTSTSRAWGGYQLLQQFFQDLTYDSRVMLMEAFFNRKRPDMAWQVFSHMRQHRNRSFHPKLEAYIQCFEGFAEHPDKEGVVAIYNLLKMDTSILPNTKLLTSLMLAYTACGRSLAALDFWSEIERSSGGPSYASLEAVFWTLEKKPNGFNRAREIWKKVEKADLDVPPAVYNAYVGAIASSGHTKEVQGLISGMALAVGSEPDAMTLGVAYNALPGQGLQSAFEDWAKKRYSEAWRELAKKGRVMTANSSCQIKIKRVIKA